MSRPPTRVRLRPHHLFRRRRLRPREDIHRAARDPTLCARRCVAIRKAASLQPGDGPESSPGSEVSLVHAPRDPRRSRVVGGGGCAPPQQLQRQRRRRRRSTWFSSRSIPSRRSIGAYCTCLSHPAIDAVVPAHAPASYAPPRSRSPRTDDMTGRYPPGTARHNACPQACPADDPDTLANPGSDAAFSSPSARRASGDQGFQTTRPHAKAAGAAGERGPDRSSLTMRLLVQRTAPAILPVVTCSSRSATVSSDRRPGVWRRRRWAEADRQLGRFMPRRLRGASTLVAARGSRRGFGEHVRVSTSCSSTTHPARAAGDRRAVVSRSPCRHGRLSISRPPARHLGVARSTRRRSTRARVSARSRRRTSLRDRSRRCSTSAGPARTVHPADSSHRAPRPNCSTSAPTLRITQSSGSNPRSGERARAPRFSRLRDLTSAGDPEAPRGCKRSATRRRWAHAGWSARRSARQA